MSRFLRRSDPLWINGSFLKQVSDVTIVRMTDDAVATRKKLLKNFRARNAIHMSILERPRYVYIRRWRWRDDCVAQSCQSCGDRWRSPAEASSIHAKSTNGNKRKKTRSTYKRNRINENRSDRRARTMDIRYMYSATLRSIIYAAVIN